MRYCYALAIFKIAFHRHSTSHLKYYSSFRLLPNETYEARSCDAVMRVLADRSRGQLSAAELTCAAA